MMVKRFALTKGVVLQQGFWNDPLWKKKFQEQCIAANALLKLYSFEAIITVLNKKSTVWSLRLNLTEDYVAAQRKIDFLKLEAEQKVPQEVVANPTFRTGGFNRKKDDGEET